MKCFDNFVYQIAKVMCFVVMEYFAGNDYKPMECFYIVMLIGVLDGLFQVPFGEVKMVQEWLGIKGEVLKPPNEHPKKPVWGFQCPRSEVSHHACTLSTPAGCSITFVTPVVLSTHVYYSRSYTSCFLVFPRVDIAILTLGE